MRLARKDNDSVRGRAYSREMNTQTKAETLAALFGKSAKPVHPILAARAEKGKK